MKVVQQDHIATQKNPKKKKNHTIINLLAISYCHAIVPAGECRLSIVQLSDDVLTRLERRLETGNQQAHKPLPQTPLHCHVHSHLEGINRDVLEI